MKIDQIKNEHISFYISKEMFSINQQLTLIYVIPLNKSKNLKSMLKYDDSFH